MSWTESRNRDRNEILAPFGWWYGSGVLDAEWAIRQLTTLAEAGVVVDPDFKVFERVQEDVGKHGARVLRFLDAYVRAELPNWTLYGVRDELRLILRHALESDEDGVRERAGNIVNLLGAKGLLEFGELLDGKESH